MAKYTTCLECGSVAVQKESDSDHTTIVCDECGNSETRPNGPQIERGLVYFDGFETLNESEVLELRE